MLSGAVFRILAIATLTLGISYHAYADDPTPAKFQIRNVVMTPGPGFQPELLQVLQTSENFPVQALVQLKSDITVELKDTLAGQGLTLDVPLRPKSVYKALLGKNADVNALSKELVFAVHLPALAKIQIALQTGKDIPGCAVQGSEVMIRIFPLSDTVSPVMTDEQYQDLLKTLSQKTNLPFLSAKLAGLVDIKSGVLEVIAQDERVAAIETYCDPGGLGGVTVGNH